MKRLIFIAICIVFAMSILSSCDKPTAPDAPLSAAELLDLGEKYLLEMNYEQAVVVFEKLIEIERRNPRGYTGLAEAYIGIGDIDSAVSVLRDGLRVLPDDASIIEALEALEPKPQATPKDEPEPTVKPNPGPMQIVQLEQMPPIEFTVDGIVVGETDLSVAKSAYSSRADYMSNPMGPGEPGVDWTPTADTVYSMPWGGDEGSEMQMLFGYFFSQPLDGAYIQTVFIRDPDFLVSGKYRVGNAASLLLGDLIGIEDITHLQDGITVFYSDDTSNLALDKVDNETFTLSSSIGNKRIGIRINENFITYFSLSMGEPLS